MWRSLHLFASRRSRREAALALLVALAVALAGALAVRAWFPALLDPAALRRWVLSFGVFAPAAFVLLQAAQVVVAPVPGQAVALVGGYLFGTVWGTLLSLLGATGGTVVAVVLARRYGRPFVERVVFSETLDRFDRLSERHGLVTLFLVFLLPGLPDDAICFAAGVTRLDVRKVLAVSVAGRLPGYVVVNFAGESLAHRDFATALVVLAALVAASLLGYRYRERVARCLGL